MKFTETILKGSYIVELTPLSDNRGEFARTFCKNEFEQIGFNDNWVQTNQSWNLKKGTLRGMHYQKPPFGEIKLVRCIRGAVQDVIIDLRKNSPTFLKYFSIELSEYNNLSLYIPQGFAHGFLTLEDATQLVYMHSQFFTPNADAGINFADPIINIQWKNTIKIISDKDKQLPLLTNQFNGI
ncbi:MAG: dTDP-4-dehydrorhamnose 3,5-epimerase [Bacteroidetes bacterium]|nr:dTDP-4-dehydrorhamnose 3,5-epimerase [Bacteroidota bacterium]